MKITHNKVGQNLNTVDSAKAGKSDATESVKGKGLSKVLDPRAEDLAQAGVDSARVEVSPRAQEAKRIKDIAMATPDVDEVKVARFRELIDSGKYQVDAKAIADKMVDEHLDSM